MRLLKLTLSLAITLSLVGCYKVERPEVTICAIRGKANPPYERCQPFKGDLFNKAMILADKDMCLSLEDQAKYDKYVSGLEETILVLQKQLVQCK